MSNAIQREVNADILSTRSKTGMSRPKTLVSHPEKLMLWYHMRLKKRPKTPITDRGSYS